MEFIRSRSVLVEAVDQCLADCSALVATGWWKMSRSGAAHPGFDPESETIDVGSLIASLRDSNRALATRTDRLRYYAWDTPALARDEFIVLCLNAGRAYCWRRVMSEHWLRRRISNAVEQDHGVKVKHPGEVVPGDYYTLEVER